MKRRIRGIQGRLTREMTSGTPMRRGFWSAVKLDVAANHKSKRYAPSHFIIVLCFSTGFQLLFSYRIQRFLIRVPLVGKLIAKFLNVFTAWLTACHVDYGADMAGGIILPHATGIVLHAERADALPAGHPAREKLAAVKDSAAFVCRGQSCSLPMTEPDALRALVRGTGPN